MVDAARVIIKCGSLSKPTPHTSKKANIPYQCIGKTFGSPPNPLNTIPVIVQGLALLNLGIAKGLSLINLTVIVAL